MLVLRLLVRVVLKLAFCAGLVFLMVYVGFWLFTEALSGSNQPPADRWVVEFVTVNDVDGEGAYWVSCAPAADLAIPFEDRPHWRLIEVDEATHATVHKGDPCPDGPIVEQRP